MRQTASLDHIGGARAAWNIVASVWRQTNLGGQSLPSHAQRSAWAAEFVEVVTRLWDSSSGGAIVIDLTGHTYVRPERVQ